MVGLDLGGKAHIYYVGLSVARAVTVAPSGKHVASPGRGHPEVFRRCQRVLMLSAVPAITVSVGLYMKYTRHF